MFPLKAEKITDYNLLYNTKAIQVCDTEHYKVYISHLSEMENEIKKNHFLRLKNMTNHKKIDILYTYHNKDYV